MTYRTPDEVFQDIPGYQQSQFEFGSKTAKLDVTTSEALIDTGDPIKGVQPGGEADFVNDDAAESVYIQMYAAQEDEDWAANPERFSPIGDEVTIGPDSAKTINWEARYNAIVFTKKATGAITGGLYGRARINGCDV